MLKEPLLSINDDDGGASAAVERSSRYSASGDRYHDAVGYAGDRDVTTPTSVLCPQTTTTQDRLARRWVRRTNRYATYRCQ